MPFDFDTVTKLVQSTPGQLAAGAALAGIVWKFFERVENVLKDDTKLEIAVWLLNRKKLGSTFQNWPDTFAKIFDRLFGDRQFSRSFLLRSILASFVAFLTVIFLMFASGRWPWYPLSFQLLNVRYHLFVRDRQYIAIALPWLMLNIIGDYLSLILTRLVVHFMAIVKRSWLVGLL